jgi:hypothetical protein
MMVRKRIKSKEELLNFTVDRYTFYTKMSRLEHGELISRHYLKDFLTDLLLIQAYADEDDNETVRSEER